jgi:hypothetical protein
MSKRAASKDPAGRLTKLLKSIDNNEKDDDDDLEDDESDKGSLINSTNFEKFILF